MQRKRRRSRHPAEAPAVDRKKFDSVSTVSLK